MCKKLRKGSYRERQFSLPHPQKAKSPGHVERSSRSVLGVEVAVQPLPHLD